MVTKSNTVKKLYSENQEDDLLTQEKTDIYTRADDRLGENEVVEKYLGEAYKNPKTLKWRINMTAFMNNTLEPAWDNPQVSADDFSDLCERRTEGFIRGCNAIAKLHKEAIEK